ncbi:sulfate ABC transporter permease subunit CysT [Roseiterribacter gracilis]|uniref:Sulfate transport system permease protein CysT n=1 Tax=Roseiterribacter gracilis TaxID=2812848 RepID=A0A8S8XCZ8_9PROT|nr:sulfate ABC transporter permease [Rhodospirillales bacterium TMPK1]
MTLALDSVRRGQRAKVLPGFRLTLGITLAWLSAIVLVPMFALVSRAAGVGFDGMIASATDARVLASFRITFGASLIAATINLVFGTMLAWALVRWRFPGRRLLDGFVDLPFALPTAVAGIALTTLWAKRGMLGQIADGYGLQIAFAPPGIAIALVFIGLPFVVRTVQPVLEELEPEIEEAAATLGASRLQTIARVVLPELLPALLTGFALAFARAVGEYGSVIFIAGNRPGQTEIVPLLIVTKLEQYDYAGAAALAVLMLLVSFVMLLAINLLQRWAKKRHGN